MYISMEAFLFSLCHTACEILVPWPEIEPKASAVKAESQPLDCQGIPLKIFFLK